MSDNDKVTHTVYNSAPDLLEAAKALIETCRRDGWQKPMPAEIDTLAECVAAEEARLAEEARADYTAHPKCYEMDGSRHCYVCRKTWNVTDAEPPCHPKPTPSNGVDLVEAAEVILKGGMPGTGYLEAALARAKEQREAVRVALAEYSNFRFGISRGAAVDVRGLDEALARLREVGL